MNEIEEFSDLVKTKGLGYLVGLKIKANESEKVFQGRVYNSYKEILCEINDE